MTPRLVRRATQAAMAVGLAAVTILTTQWAYPAGHLAIQMGSPYYARTVGDYSPFVQIAMTLRNVGADYVKVDGEHFLLVDDAGNRYARDPSTHFIQNHYDYLWMAPGYQFTATSIYKLPAGHEAAAVLFITATGQRVWFRLARPSGVARAEWSGSSAAPAGPLGHATGGRPDQSPTALADTASHGTGQLAEVLAEMAARSKGLSSQNIAEADQLIDLLPHLRATCAAGSRDHGRALVDAAARCAAEATAATNVIVFIRETLESPAGGGVPAVVRHDWDTTLASAATAVRDALTLVWNATGREQALAHDPDSVLHAVALTHERIRSMLAQGPSTNR